MFGTKLRYSPTSLKTALRQSRSIPANSHGTLHIQEATRSWVLQGQLLRRLLQPTGTPRIARRRPRFTASQRPLSLGNKSASVTRRFFTALAFASAFSRTLVPIFTSFGFAKPLGSTTCYGRVGVESAFAGSWRGGEIGAKSHSNHTSEPQAPQKSVHLRELLSANTSGGGSHGRRARRPCTGFTGALGTGPGFRAKPRSSTCRAPAQPAASLRSSVRQKGSRALRRPLAHDSRQRPFRCTVTRQLPVGSVSRRELVPTWHAGFTNEQRPGIVRRFDTGGCGSSSGR